MATKNCNSFLFFADVTIPATAIIDVGGSYISCYTVYAVGTCQTKIYADDQASPGAPTSAVDHNGRSRTTNGVDWDGVADANGFEDSTDIEDVISELQTSYDYSGGNPILILVDNDGSSTSHRTNCNTYDRDSAYAAKLHIEYTVGGVTHEGSATLSGVGTLAAIGRGIFIGKSTLSGTGTLAAIGRGIFAGKATLAGTGTLAAIGSFFRYGTATLTGTGTLAASAVRILVGKATLSGLGTLTGIGRIIFAGKATLTGVGTLSAIGRRIAGGRATLAGVGTLAAIAHMTYAGKATLSGIGTLVAVGESWITVAANRYRRLVGPHFKL